MLDVVYWSNQDRESGEWFSVVEITGVIGWVPTQTLRVSSPDYITKLSVRIATNELSVVDYLKDNANFAGLKDHINTTVGSRKY